MHNLLRCKTIHHSRDLRLKVFYQLLCLALARVLLKAVELGIPMIDRLTILCLHRWTAQMFSPSNKIRLSTTFQGIVPLLLL